MVDTASVDLLAAAYKGAERVFVHLPVVAEADRLQYAHNIAQAISRAKPQRVVVSISGQKFRILPLAADECHYDQNVRAFR